MKVFKRTIAVILFLCCFTAVLVMLTEGGYGGIAPAIVTLLLGLLFWRSSNKVPKKKPERVPSVHGLLHIEGLPLAEKTRCSVELVYGELRINGGGADFKLQLNQIGAIEVKTDVEIAHIISSSATKGIAGGLIFGPVGAIVGSRAKSKEVRKATPYLVVNYVNSEGTLSAMLFDASLDPWSLNKFLRVIQPMVSNNPRHQVQL